MSRRLLWFRSVKSSVFAPQMDYLEFWCIAAGVCCVFLIFTILNALQKKQSKNDTTEKKKVLDLCRIHQACSLPLFCEITKEDKLKIGAIKYLWRPYALYLEIIADLTALFVYWNSHERNAKYYFAWQLFWIILHQVLSALITYFLETSANSGRDALIQLFGLNAISQMYNEAYTDESSWQMRQIVKLQACLLSLPSMISSLVFGLSSINDDEDSEIDSMGKWYLIQIMIIVFGVANVTFAFNYEDSLALKEKTFCWRSILFLFRGFNVLFRCWLWASLAAYVNYTFAMISATLVLWATIFYRIQETGTCHSMESDAGLQMNRLRNLTDIVFESVGLYFTIQINNIVLYCSKTEDKKILKKDQYFWMTYYQAVEIILLVGILMFKAFNPDVALSLADSEKADLDPFNVFFLRLLPFLGCMILFLGCLKCGGAYDAKLGYLIKYGAVKDLLTYNHADIGSILELLVIRKEITEMSQKQNHDYVELVGKWLQNKRIISNFKDFTPKMAMQRILLKRHFSCMELALLKFPQKDILEHLSFEDELYKSTAKELARYNLKFKVRDDASKQTNTREVLCIEADGEVTDKEMVGNDLDRNEAKKSEPEKIDVPCFNNIKILHDIKKFEKEWNSQKPIVILQYAHAIEKYEHDGFYDYDFFRLKMSNRSKNAKKKDSMENHQKVDDSEECKEEDFDISEDQMPQGNPVNRKYSSVVSNLSPAPLKLHPSLSDPVHSKSKTINVGVNGQKSPETQEYRYVLKVDATKDNPEMWIELELKRKVDEEHVLDPYTLYETDNFCHHQSTMVTYTEELKTDIENRDCKSLDFKKNIKNAMAAKKSGNNQKNRNGIDWTASQFKDRFTDQKEYEPVDNWKDDPQHPVTFMQRYCSFPFSLSWLCCCPCIGFCTTRRMCGCRYGSKLTMYQIMHKKKEREFENGRKEERYLVDDGDIILYADAEPDGAWLPLAQGGNWGHCGLIYRYKKSHLEFLPKHWQQQLKAWEDEKIIQEDTPLVFEMTNHGRWYYGEKLKVHLTHLEKEYFRDSAQNRQGATVGFRQFTGDRNSDFYASLYTVMDFMWDKDYNSTATHFMATVVPCRCGTENDQMAEKYYCSQLVAFFFMDLGLADGKETQQFPPSAFGMTMAWWPFCYMCCFCLTGGLAPWLAFIGGDTCRENNMTVWQTELRDKLGKLYILMKESVDDYKDQKELQQDDRDYLKGDYHKIAFFASGHNNLDSNETSDSKDVEKVIDGYPKQVDLSVSIANGISQILLFVMHLGCFALCLTARSSGKMGDQICLAVTTLVSFGAVFFICRLWLDDEGLEGPFLSGFADYEVMYMWYYVGLLFAACEDMCNSDLDKEKLNDFYYHFYTGAFYAFGFTIDENCKKNENDKCVAFSQLGPVKIPLIQVLSLTIGIVNVLVLRGIDFDGKHAHTVTLKTDPLMYLFASTTILYVFYQVGQWIVGARIRSDVDKLKLIILPSSYFSYIVTRRIIMDMDMGEELRTLVDVKKKTESHDVDIKDLQKDYKDLKEKFERLVEGKFGFIENQKRKPVAIPPIETAEAPRSPTHQV